MKYLHVFILALFASGNANACLSVLFDDEEVAELYNYGEVLLTDSADAPRVQIINSCSVTEITVSISGNTGEFCFENPDEIDGKCPNTTQYGVFDLYFKPLHPGKKKKKLTIDGLNDGNDVSKTIILIGETPPRTQSP